jgi:methionine sulfoxide reductase heme-binding subunit
MRRFIKPVLFVVSLLPAAYLLFAVYLVASGGVNLLGPDPAKALTLQSGEWAIRFLILALSMTPVRHLFSWPYAWQLRRMTGLFAFFYATLHFMVFLIFLLELRWQELLSEIVERPYIMVGFAAIFLMLPLGLTSFSKAQRALGKNWKRLHRVIYLVNILAVLHVVWIVRSNYGDALLYGSLVVLLLGYRLLRELHPAVRTFTLRNPGTRSIGAAAGKG